MQKGSSDLESRQCLTWHFSPLNQQLQRIRILVPIQIFHTILVRKNSQCSISVKDDLRIIISLTPVNQCTRSHVQVSLV